MRYDKAGYYGRHLDDVEEDIFDVLAAPRASRRRLSFICYLTDEAWQESDGGILRAYDQREGLHEDHLPTRYAAAVLRSMLYPLAPHTSPLTPRPAASC